MSNRFFIKQIIFLGIIFGVFGRHISGRLSFPYDFIDQYVPSIFNWNELGGFLNPPSWNPIMYFGYPFYEDVQFGWSVLDQLLSWGFVYDWQIGVISQMIILFLSLNLTCKFFEIFGAKYALSILLSLSYCFSATTFSNASHMDTWRGFILFPSLLYVLSTKFLLQNKYNLILASLFLWQYNAIAYPGAQVFAIYGGIVFVFFQILELERQNLLKYILRISLNIFITFALTLPKMFYSIMFLSEITPNKPNTVNIFSSLAINIFSIYDVENLSIDVTMRSLLIALPITIFLIFRQRINYLYYFSTILLIIFLISGAGGGNVLIDSIPGFNLSRYRAMDARLLLVMSATLYALNILNNRNVIQNYKKHKSLFDIFESFFQPIRLTVLFIILITFLTREFIPTKEKILMVFLFILTTLFLVLYLQNSKLLYAILIVGIGAFHVHHVANQAARTWKVESSVIINNYIGSKVKDYYLDKPVNYLNRPERINLTEFRDESGRFNPKWTKYIYQRDFLTFGYVNNKGTEFPNAIKKFYNSDPMVFQFMQEPSEMLELGENFTKSYLNNSNGLISRNNEKFKILNFRSNKEVWKINLEEDTFVVQNERNDGYWNARLEYESSGKVEIINSQIYRGVLRSWNLPAGRYTMFMQHDPPFFNQFIILQKLVLMCCLLYILIRRM